MCIRDRVFEVKATNGDTHLGGDDFDQRVIDWLLAEFKKDPVSYTHLRAHETVLDLVCRLLLANKQ